MRKYIVLVFLAIILVTAVTGCCTNQSSGSREFIPGRGWVPND